MRFISIKNRITNIFLRVIAAVPITRRKYCVICNNHIGFFLPYRNGKMENTPLMTALETIGSDIDNFTCPRCGCNDRERHLHLYMQAVGIYDLVRDSKVLHFAPERRLPEILQLCQPNKYITADLNPNKPDMHKVDLTDMPYQNESFDFIIANHVLEHVNDHVKAIKEIHRVLSIGGYAILQTPYSSILTDTFHDPGISSGNARLHAYGQEDHARLFGCNIFNIFSSYGLNSQVKFHDEILSSYSPKKYGLNRKEPLFLFQKI